MPESPLFSGGINAFIELKDTPASFIGQSGKTPIVKATEDKLEFTTLVGGDMLAATYDPASKSEQLLGESDIVTAIGNPGSDTKVPSEQGIREALDVINQRKIKDQYYGIIASGNTTGTLTKPAGAGADVDFIMDGWGVSVDALLSKVDANDIPTFEPPVNAAGAIITTSFATNGNYTLTDTPSPAAKHAIVFIYTCYFQNFLVAESMQKTEWIGDVIYETDFAATSFLYATSKNTPENKTPAEVKAILNLEIGTDIVAKDAPVHTGQATIPTINLTGGQIAFPATAVPSADPNTMDDYEKGEWTMGVSFGGGTTGITYNNNIGSYTKIGNSVRISGYLLLTSKGSSVGSMKATGLPFAIYNNYRAIATCALYISKITFANFPLSQFIHNTTTIDFKAVTEAGAVSALDNTNFANDSSFVLGGIYEI